MLKFAFEYCHWIYLKTLQGFHSTRLRYMVWLYPEAARTVAVRARWFGHQNNDAALLSGAEFIERLLSHRR
jgi:hypothetical protein